MSKELKKFSLTNEFDGDNKDSGKKLREKALTRKEKERQARARQTLGVSITAVDPNTDSKKIKKEKGKRMQIDPNPEDIIMGDLDKKDDIAVVPEIAKKIAEAEPKKTTNGNIIADRIASKALKGAIKYFRNMEKNKNPNVPNPNDANTTPSPIINEGDAAAKASGDLNLDKNSKKTQAKADTVPVPDSTAPEEQISETGDSKRKSISVEIRKKITDLIEKNTDIRTAIGGVYNFNDDLKGKTGCKPEDFIKNVVRRFMKYKDVPENGGKYSVQELIINMANKIKKGEDEPLISDIKDELVLNAKNAAYAEKKELALPTVIRELQTEIEKSEKDAKTNPTTLAAMKTKLETYKKELIKLKSPTKKEKKLVESDAEFEEKVKNAGNFDGLYEAIKNKGNIHTKKKTYKADDLIAIIKNARSKKTVIDNYISEITSEFGLREKTKELIKKEYEKELSESEKTEPSEIQKSEVEVTKTTEKSKTSEEKGSELRKQIDEAWVGVRKAREEYLRVDYKKNTALQRIRNYFSNKGTDLYYFAKDKYKEREKMKEYEKDEEIAAFRAYYDNELFKVQELVIKDAKERGASNEELAKLYIDFRVEQRITMADDHDRVRSEEMEGTNIGKIGEKMVKISKWYQDLPLSVKLGIGAAFVVGGGGLAFAGIAGATAIGSTAASVFLGASTFKRIFGGMTAGVGISLGLEARGQKKDRINIEDQKKNFRKVLENMTPDEKYKLVADNIKEVAIKDVDNQINKIKNQDIKQLATGAIVGSAIGSGLVSMGFHKVAEHFGWFSHGIEHASNTANHTSGSAIDSVKNTVPVAGTAGAYDDVRHLKEAAALNTPPHMENLTIKPGGSIERALIDHIKETNPKIGNSDAGRMAHRMFLDYMHDNKEAIVAKVGEGEYGKMLKDGMVNVKAVTGLNLVIDANDNFKLNLIDGDISHIEHSAPSSPSGMGSVLKESMDGSDYDNDIQGGDAVSNETPVESPKVENAIHNAAPDNLEKDFYVEETKLSAQDHLDNMHDKYLEEVDESLKSGGNKLVSGETLFAEDAAKKTVEQLATQDIPWSSLHGIDEIINHGGGTREILHESLQKITAGSLNKQGIWSGIKNMPFDQALEKSELLKKGLTNALGEFKKILGSEAMPKINPVNGMKEETGKWLARVTKMAVENKK